MGGEVSYTTYAIATILAFVPAVMWIYLFNKHNPENKKTIVITFIAGMFSTAIILVYAQFWNHTVNLVFFEFTPVSFKNSIANMFNYEGLHILKSHALDNVPMAILATFFLFVGVGAMEEYAKHWVVKICDRPFFRSIDDVIELSIVAALGFAFAENILYFTSKWDQLGSTQFAAFVFFRVTVVTMVHVLCSGIYGYFYGLAYFAHPVLQDEMKAGKKFFFTEKLHKILHMKTETIFKEEKIMEGLLLAVILHALYDFILDLNLTVGDLFAWVGLDVNINIALYTIAMPLYLVAGYFYLAHLLDKKEDHKKYGKMVMRQEFVMEGEGENKENGENQG